MFLPSSESNQGKYLVLALESLSQRTLVNYYSLNNLGACMHSIISWVPFPWWTSKSTMAILFILSLYLFFKYAAATATLLIKQKPFVCS